MWDRYRPIAILAGALFVVDALGIFIVSLLKPHQHGHTTTSVLTIMFIAVVTGVAAFGWIVRYPMNKALTNLGLGVVAGCVVSALLATFAGGYQPFDAGAGNFFLKIWIFLAAAAAGTILAALLAMAIGRDYRAQALKRFADTKAARPNRPVRR